MFEELLFPCCGVQHQGTTTIPGATKPEKGAPCPGDALLHSGNVRGFEDFQT